MVSTAGHCVNEGPGAYATNWAFVPAYDDGARPYGTFTARSLVTTTQWQSSGDFDYDVAFAVMNPVGGIDLTDTVGSQGIGFNLAARSVHVQLRLPRGQPVRRHGHRVVPRHRHPGHLRREPGPGAQLQHDRWVLGRSRGSPTTPTTSGVGTQNSVNSFGYTSLRNVMWGPYFGAVAQSAYTTAQGL